MARYGGSLAWQYQMPVESVLVMLRPDRAPAEIPEVGHYDIGDTHTTHPFKVVRLWEIDPTPVLETNNPKLLPWALLMKSTDEQVRKIASIVARQEDDEAAGRFLTLGCVRYDRDALNEMLGGGKMGLLRAILDGQSRWRRKGRKPRRKARREGLAQGRGGRRGARTGGRGAQVSAALAQEAFPELESLAEIDAISNVNALETIIESVLDATGADPVRTAILKQPNQTRFPTSWTAK